VLADEKAEGIDPFSGESQAPADGFSDLLPPQGMRGAFPLSQIMDQRGQFEEARVPDLLHQFLGKRPGRRRVSPLQHFQLLDGIERVNVHRVEVVTIVLDVTVDPLKLREKLSQKSRLIHLLEDPVEMSRLFEQG
jgi:hypothetical protein